MLIVIPVFYWLWCAWLWAHLILPRALRGKYYDSCHLHRSKGTPREGNKAAHHHSAYEEGLESTPVQPENTGCSISMACNNPGPSFKPPFLLGWTTTKKITLITIEDIIIQVVLASIFLLWKSGAAFLLGSGYHFFLFVHLSSLTCLYFPRSSEPLRRRWMGDCGG